MLSRRHFLAGGGAAAMMPTRAWAHQDADVRHALDAAATLPPDRALALLSRFENVAASTGARLDLAAARAGLGVDLALKQRTLDAAERFAFQVQRIAGNDATLERVARDLDVAHRALVAQAAALLDQLAVPGKSVGARFEALWRDPRNLFPDDEEGRAAAINAMRATLATIRPRLPRLIGMLPVACRRVEVRGLDAREIAAGKGGYRILPDMGIRGSYVVDLKEIRRRPRFSLPSVVAHELLPGHMAQMPLEARAAPHPLRLRYAAAFPEGWGIYAEMLMAEDGLFADPLDMLGHLHWLLFRVCRGLADIAIHARGEAPEQALADIRASMGEPAYFAPFAADVTRITKEPAIRAAEAWVPLRLGACRPHSCSKWPGFHSILLRNGRRRTEQF
ncbi:DUF885 family protein [Sphingomonas sp. TDK1]|uniref:DUF885 family protein n=1 Tax=Sphingomonas sp. TDK1 TaxID=453247 RepID=UPI0007D9957E|nr:DUF885 family protein [Sphingomonas sp. TDK1]OAN63163.1 hypothetical protein A7X12_01475 [Sphingomonas sp. TDK1]